MSNGAATLIAVGWGSLFLLIFFLRERLWGAIDGGFERIRGNRMVVFGLAVFLVAVPTFASLFPGFILRVTRWWRIAAMLVWLLVAVLATLVSQGRERSVHAMTRASHWLVLRQAVDGILAKARETVDVRYEFSIHLLNETEDSLLPWYPEKADDMEDPAVFEVGQGAVGHCFESEEVVVAVGDAVSTSEPFGLSDPQRARYANYQIVAAVPVRLTSDLVIGTLSVISHINDGYFVSDDGELQEEGVKLLEDLADKVGDLLSLEGIEWGW